MILPGIVYSRKGVMEIYAITLYLETVAGWLRIQSLRLSEKVISYTVCIPVTSNGEQYRADHSTEHKATQGIGRGRFGIRSPGDAT